MKRYNSLRLFIEIDNQNIVENCDKLLKLKKKTKLLINANVE